MLSMATRCGFLVWEDVVWASNPGDIGDAVRPIGFVLTHFYVQATDRGASERYLAS